jgi:hypothetical protein
MVLDGSGVLGPTNWFKDHFSAKKTRPIDVFMTYRQTKILFFGGYIPFCSDTPNSRRTMFCQGNTLDYLREDVCVYCSIVFLVRCAFLDRNIVLLRVFLDLCPS